jgi:uncharacterized protein YdgA (DUF945 family)
MKRKIGIYVVLIAIIIGAAPYLVGFLVETRFKDVVKVASELESTKVDVVEYHRGWRKSHAITRITLSGKFVDGFHASFPGKSTASVSPKTINILVTHDIHHGPFVQLKEGDYANWVFALATIHSSLTEEANKKLMAVVGETDVLMMDSEITIDGTTKAKIKGKELKIAADAQEHVLWKGLTGNWELSRDFKRLECNMVMPGFDAIFEDKRVIGEDVVFKTERFKTPEGLWLGNVKMDLQKLQIDVAQKTVFTLAGLAASGVTDTENQMIESSGTLRIEGFKFGEEQFGPLNYSGSVKNISPSVMKSFIDIANAMDGAPESEQQQYVEQLIALIPDFLKARPELVIDDLSLRAPQGEIKSALGIAVGGPEANDIKNPQAIIQSIFAKGNVLVPKPLYHEILGEMIAQGRTKAQQPAQTEQEATNAVNELIASQIKEGLWQEKGTSLLMEYEFKDGKLTVNGKPLDLMKLFFDAKMQGTQAPATSAAPVPGVGPVPTAPDSGTSSISAPQ